MKKFNEWLEERHPEYFETSLVRRMAVKGRRLWDKHGDTVKNVAGAALLGAGVAGATAHGFGAGHAALPIAAVGGVMGGARHAIDAIADRMRRNRRPATS
jgi:hypothetical protein